MNTREEKQQHVGVPTVSCQIPRCGCGVGSVSWSWPVGSSMTGTLMLAIASERDSVAVNGAGVLAELGAQGLGLMRNVGSVQGLMVFIL
jgi:hypothetical protein